MNGSRAHGFTRNVLPALAYVVVIFVGGSWPNGPETEPVFALQDKVLHLLAFAGLELLVLRALRHLWPAKGRAWLLGVSVVLSCLLGALLEFWQALLPSRQAEALDWLADVAGALLAALGSWRSNV
ncbi:MAG TPA: VanZ family protein, partial [Polyangiaceae bacterium]